MTGEQIPASVTASGLRKFYREAAAKYAARQKMTADAKESAQQAEADQAVADAAARMETDPAAAFRPTLDNTQQPQYNKEGRSPEVTSIIDRLNKGEVPLDEVMSLPKIVEIEQQNSTATPTIALPDREAIQDTAYEQAMARGSFNGTDYSGPVRQERRIDIVLGLPGSGKSSVYTERISQEHGSRVIDTDDYREFIPSMTAQMHLLYTRKRLKSSRRSWLRPLPTAIISYCLPSATMPESWKKILKAIIIRGTRFTYTLMSCPTTNHRRERWGDSLSLTAQRGGMYRPSL